MAKRPTEAQLAKRVVRMLEKDGWEVYKEVLHGKKVCDIYAVKRDGRRKTTWAIEVKTSFGITVMEQAAYWKRHADYASVAVPRAKRRRSRSFGYKLCSELGLGVIEITSRKAKEHARARKNRNTTTPRLVEAQKKSTAGSPDGNHWTPFQETCNKLIKLVKTQEGISLRDAVETLDHHYKHDRSAFSSLKKHIRKGVIPELKLHWPNGVPHIYLK